MTFLIPLSSIVPHISAAMLNPVVVASAARRFEVSVGNLLVHDDLAFGLVLLKL